MPHVLGALAGALQSGLRQHDRKLLTAVAAGDVGGTNIVRDCACHRAEHEITRVVAVFVVEALEMVDIDHHD